MEAAIYALAIGVDTANGEDDEEAPLDRVRPALIAANLLAQQHLRAMNGALIVRFLNHALELQYDERAPIRALAIRLMRMFAKKMPDFTLREYQVSGNFVFFLQRHLCVNKLCRSSYSKQFSLPIRPKTTPRRCARR